MNLSSKTIFWTVLNLILVAATVIIWKILIFGLPVLPERATVTVSAEGKSVVAPDIARVSFSVVTEGADPKVIQEENTKKMNTAIDFVKQQGIDGKDIKTANYNLYPRYDYGYPRSPMIQPDTPRIIGYTLTQTVLVKVRDLEKVPAIVGGLPSRGINQIEQISFDIDDHDRYLNDARAEAFRKARAKADAMAKANGVRVRKVVTFSENTGGFPIPYLRAEALGGGGDFGGAPPQIEPGTQDVTVQVSVTYEIR